jgi:hypothetical protein
MRHEVAGVVAVWGTVQIHQAGMRAEFARVSAVAHFPGWKMKQNYAAEMIAERLGIDLVEYGELRSAARQYGEPLGLGGFTDLRSA